MYTIATQSQVTGFPHLSLLYQLLIFNYVPGGKQIHKIPHKTLLKKKKYSSFIHNCQNSEATKMPFSR